MARDDEANILSFLRILVELGGVLSIVLYGLSWIFVVHLFGQFAVAPEDVGISAQWLIVRATTTAVPLAAVATVVFSDQGLRHVLGDRALRIVQRFVLGLIVVSIPMWFLFFRGQHPMSTVFIITVFCLAFAAFMLAVLRNRTSPSRANRRHPADGRRDLESER